MQVDEIRKLKQAFYQHKSRAKRSAIPWDFTFEQWLEIWVDSGKLEQRGKKAANEGGGWAAGYCMARFGDVGPYAPGNVKIITIQENAAERFVNRRCAIAIACG